MRTFVISIAAFATLVAFAGMPSSVTALTEAQFAASNTQNGPQSKVGQAPAAPAPTKSGGAEGQEIPNCEPLVQQFNEAINTG